MSKSCQLVKLRAIARSSTRLLRIRLAAKLQETRSWCRNSLRHFEFSGKVFATDYMSRMVLYFQDDGLSRSSHFLLIQRYEIGRLCRPSASVRKFGIKEREPSVMNTRPALDGNKSRVLLPRQQRHNFILSLHLSLLLLLFSCCSRGTVPCRRGRCLPIIHSLTRPSTRLHRHCRARPHFLSAKMRH